MDKMNTAEIAHSVPLPLPTTTIYVPTCEHQYQFRLSVLCRSDLVLPHSLGSTTYTSSRRMQPRHEESYTTASASERKTWMEN